VREREREMGREMEGCKDGGMEGLVGGFGGGRSKGGEKVKASNSNGERKDLIPMQDYKSKYCHV
jgi:hypothetical protein